MSLLQRFLQTFNKFSPYWKQRTETSSAQHDYKWQIIVVKGSNNHQPLFYEEQLPAPSRACWLLTAQAMECVSKGLLLACSISSHHPQSDLLTWSSASQPAHPFPPGNSCDMCPPQWATSSWLSCQSCHHLGFCVKISSEDDKNTTKHGYRKGLEAAPPPPADLAGRTKEV